MQLNVTCVSEGIDTCFTCVKYLCLPSLILIIRRVSVEPGRAPSSGNSHHNVLVRDINISNKCTIKNVESNDWLFPFQCSEFLKTHPYAIFHVSHRNRFCVMNINSHSTHYICHKAHFQNPPKAN